MRTAESGAALEALRKRDPMRLFTEGISRLSIESRVPSFKA
jgi:hypothetical protein